MRDIYAANPGLPSHLPAVCLPTEEWPSNMSFVRNVSFSKVPAKTADGEQACALSSAASDAVSINRICMRIF